MSYLLHKLHCGQFRNANTIPGLQTPRLKRLAEIVSAQAIAQQEKMEYGSQDGYENGALEEVDETPEPIEASA